MQSEPVNARWQALMAPYFDNGDAPADQQMRAIEEVFHLPEERGWARERHDDEQRVADGIRDLSIELPSWAFGNSGTRFKVFAQQGVPRDPYEKVADAAQVHRFTGVAPTRGAAHPVGPGRRLRDLAKHAADLGVRLGTINSNVFQDDDYMLGSVCQPRCAGPAQGHRPPARVHRHHGCDRVARPQAVVRRRHELPGPGRHPRPPGPARPRRCRGLRPARDGPADGPRVQALRAGVLHDRRPRLGNRLHPLRRPRARRRRSSSTPATTPRARTSSSSSPSLLRPDGSAGSTSTRGSTPTTT